MNISHCHNFLFLVSMHISQCPFLVTIAIAFVLSINNIFNFSQYSISSQTILPFYYKMFYFYLLASLNLTLYHSKLQFICNWSLLILLSIIQLFIDAIYELFFFLKFLK